MKPLLINADNSFLANICRYLSIYLSLSLWKGILQFMLKEEERLVETLLF